MGTQIIQGRVVIGLFCLATFELVLMVCDHAVANLDIFKTITQATFVSGLLVIVNFLFGSSSGSAAKDAVISKQLDKAP